MKPRISSPQRKKAKAWNKGLARIRFAVPVEVGEQIDEIAREARMPVWRVINALMTKGIALRPDTDKPTMRAMLADMKEDIQRLEDALKRLCSRRTS